MREVKKIPFFFSLKLFFFMFSVFLPFRAFFLPLLFYRPFKYVVAPPLPYQYYQIDFGYSVKSFEKVVFIEKLHIIVCITSETRESCICYYLWSAPFFFSLHLFAEVSTNHRLQGNKAVELFELFCWITGFWVNWKSSLQDKFVLIVWIELAFEFWFAIVQSVCYWSTRPNTPQFFQEFRSK